MYSGKFSGLVGSYSFPMFYCPFFLSSIGCSLHVLDVKDISWCCVLYSLEHLVNYIVPVFQFTSRLCLTNKLYLRNMSLLFKSVTVMLIYSVCLLISSSSGANLVTSPFLILSALETSNNLFIGSVLIFSFFTNYITK